MPALNEVLNYTLESAGRVVNVKRTRWLASSKSVEEGCWVLCETSECRLGDTSLDSRVMGVENDLGSIFTNWQVVSNMLVLIIIKARRLKELHT